MGIKFDKKILVIVGALIYFGATATGSQLGQLKLFFQVTKYKLSNGLIVLLHEDHSVPMITYHTWYRVGSKDETKGATGAAHMLEHMMFKGAKEYTGSDFDKILHLNGMSNNAFTTHDYTGFYQELPSDKLELMMKIEVDRMSHLALQNDDLQGEREVVKEERRWRVDNNPLGLMNENMMLALFRLSRYGWPVIGYMEDIESYDSQKLRTFYERFYVPNNAVLVLVGDFKTEQVKVLIEKYYGPLSARPIQNETWEPEPLIQEPRVVRAQKNLESSTAALAFLAPGVGHEDVYALDLLANVLGAGRSSRLHKEFVVQRQQATEVFTTNWTLKHGGVFYLGAAFKPGIEVGQIVQSQLMTSLDKVKNQLLSSDELAKAQTMVLKEHVDSIRTIDGKARALAINEVLTGDYRSLFTDLDKYLAVTPEKVQEVARKYLDRKRSVWVVLEPPRRL